MKRKSCLVLTEIVITMVLTCACAGGQKAEEPQRPQESVSSAPTETDVPELSGTEAEDTETQTDDTADRMPAPDLNRNGIAEEVRLTEIDDGQGVQLEIWENDELIDRETGYFAHTGWTSIFLCTMDGEDYLLRYHPTMFQGYCTYSYSLSALTDNEETVVQGNRVEFDINFGASVHNSFEPEAIAAFMDEINGLLSCSVPLLNTDSDLMDTFEKEGRLYDSLWWLDSWEPVFVRDESRSLLENLKDFQTAVAAAQEPPAREEVDGLPITEPLEMVFCSGAGAWGTVLTLNPDGSFVGDYSDADGLIHYVCQFHGQFGKVEKLTDASWLLTLEELELDTSHSVGEEWDEPYGDYMFHYISSDPYGFDGADGTALGQGAQFILYSPDATGHEPGTELYGAAEFQSWMHGRRAFNSADDILGCWGLQNMETGRGFFTASDVL